MVLVHAAGQRRMRQMEQLARRATNDAVAKFNARVERKNQRLRQKGKAPPVYYTRGVNAEGKKTFTGGKDLQSSAVYPQRFCTALFKVWLVAYQATAQNSGC